jgi:hypothetical protein
MLAIVSSEGGQFVAHVLQWNTSHFAIRTKTMPLTDFLGWICRPAQGGRTSCLSQSYPFRSRPPITKGVEHPIETRLMANQPVTVSSCGLIKLPTVAGRAIDMSGTALRLRLPNPIPRGSPVKVEAEHMVTLGEVSRCQYDLDSYIVSLMLLQPTPSRRAA